MTIIIIIIIKQLQQVLIGKNTKPKCEGLLTHHDAI